MADKVYLKNGDYAFFETTPITLSPAVTSIEFDYASSGQPGYVAFGASQSKLEYGINGSDVGIDIGDVFTIQITGTCQTMGGQAPVQLEYLLLAQTLVVDFQLTIVGLQTPF